MKTQHSTINEADRIGTAVWRSHIPPKYKQYPIINQGSTSLILDAGNDEVLMLTRDMMKRDWLTQSWGLDLGQEIDSFEMPHQRSRDIGEMRVSVIKLPRLYPLSATNKRAVKQGIEFYDVIQRKNMSYGQRDKQARQQKVLTDYLEAHPDGLFAHLVDFLTNYGTDQYHADFLMRNFMQNKDGQIVLIDPIVSADLLSALQAIRTDRQNNRY